METPNVNTSDGQFYSKVVRDKIKSLNPPAGDVIKNDDPGKEDNLHYTGTGSIKKPQSSEVI